MGPKQIIVQLFQEFRSEIAKVSEAIIHCAFDSLTHRVMIIPNDAHMTRHILVEL